VIKDVDFHLVQSSVMVRCSSAELSDPLRATYKEVKQSSKPVEYENH
jgi:hypothetical protein